MSSKKLQNPSAGRNSQPILETLQKILNANKTGLKLLEISSGTGQHSAYFANEFKNVEFQPSEFDKTMFRSIEAYAADVNNMLDPIHIDISKDFSLWETQFQPETFDYMLNINMIHISPWKCTEGLFQNAGQLLKKNGLLITYGPYSVNNLLTPESNVRFNEMLQSQNPDWGVRDVSNLKELAQKCAITFKQSYDMPANNKTLIWEKI